MASAPQYQVAFQFQFQQNLSNEAVQIEIIDQNRFVLSNGEKIQLAPFDSATTPPLNNMSVSSNALFLNIARGQASEGVETILWTTFSDGESVRVNLTADAAVAAYYTVLGAPGGSGTLMPGPNTIALAGGE